MKDTICPEGKPDLNGETSTFIQPRERYCKVLIYLFTHKWYKYKEQPKSETSIEELWGITSPFRDYQSR